MIECESWTSRGRGGFYGAIGAPLASRDSGRFYSEIAPVEEF